MQNNSGKTTILQIWDCKYSLFIWAPNIIIPQIRIMIKLALFTVFKHKIMLHFNIQRTRFWVHIMKQEECIQQTENMYRSRDRFDAPEL